jgi:hypothetical protein
VAHLLEFREMYQAQEMILNSEQIMFQAAGKV